MLVMKPRTPLHEFVIQALERQVRRRQGMQAYAEIIRIRDAIRGRTGVQPDSSPMIRLLREGQGRHG